ncbi:MAG: PEP/pyruvate-binding domain-containing protein, partial [Halobacillus sp.]
MNNQFVFLFDQSENGKKELLGGKGANLAEMTRIGLPVPYGFTITTAACHAYYDAGQVISPEVESQVLEALHTLETKTDKRLGDPANPLLVSVRSGAVHSMPGMMDTVLNLGMNDDTVEGMAELTNNPRFAYDSYRRFIQMFSNVVLKVDHYLFEQRLEDIREEKGYHSDTELTAEDWKQVIETFKSIVLKTAKRSFPEDPKEQLFLTINAVFDSWNNQRAVLYR